MRRGCYFVRSPPFRTAGEGQSSPSMAEDVGRQLCEPELGPPLRDLGGFAPRVVKHNDSRRGQCETAGGKLGPLQFEQFAEESLSPLWP